MEQGLHLFAPNGKPSNLSKEDFEYSRSYSFKEIAGDWESARIVKQARNAWKDDTSSNKTNILASERFRERVKDLTGLDIRLVVITDSNIRHIKNHHGRAERLRGQEDFSPEDIAVIPYILDNFDNIERVPQYDDRLGGQALLISKRINGVTYVGTINKGERNEFVITAWSRKMSAALDASLSGTPGLYVLNDADLIAKVKKDIENIKDSAEKCTIPLDDNGEPTAECISAVRAINDLELVIAQDEAKLQTESSSDDEQKEVLHSIKMREKEIEELKASIGINNEFNIENTMIDNSLETTYGRDGKVYRPQPLETSGLPDGLSSPEELISGMAERFHLDWMKGRAEDFFKDYKSHETDYCLNRILVSKSTLEAAERFKEGARAVSNIDHAQHFYHEFPAFKPWAELSSEQQHGALSQARSILETAGVKYTFSEGHRTSEGTMDYDKREAFVEAMARNAHEVWSKSKIEKGYVWGERRNDDPVKGPLTHPDLIPFEDLTPREREYDEIIARSAYNFLHERGLEVEPKNAEKESIDRKTDPYFAAIPYLTKIYTEEAQGLIRGDKMEEWKEKLPEMLNNELYADRIVKDTLKLINVYNAAWGEYHGEGKDPAKGAVLDEFIRQGHSGESAQAILANIREYMFDGEAIADIISKDMEKNAILESLVNSLPKGGYILKNDEHFTQVLIIPSGDGRDKPEVVEWVSGEKPRGYTLEKVFSYSDAKELIARREELVKQRFSEAMEDIVKNCRAGDSNHVVVTGPVFCLPGGENANEITLDRTEAGEWLLGVGTNSVKLSDLDETDGLSPEKFHAVSSYCLGLVETVRNELRMGVDLSIEKETNVMQSSPEHDRLDRIAATGRAKVTQESLTPSKVSCFDSKREEGFGKAEGIKGPSGPHK